jgi:starch phosphorylase
MPTGNDDLDQIKSAVLAKLALDLGKDVSMATDRGWFVAAALTIRDRIVHRWLEVDRASHAQGGKRVYYLSLEFLIGCFFPMPSATWVAPSSFAPRWVSISIG